MAEVLLFSFAMSHPKEITDWGLAEELAKDSPSILVALVVRVKPEHGFLLKDLVRLQAGLKDRLELRFVDLVENPSPFAAFALRKLPAVLLFSRGVERARWEGSVDLAAVKKEVGDLARSIRNPD